MEWVDALRGRVVGLDTAPLIYFVEEHPDYIDIVNPFFEAVGRGEVEVVTSIVTYLEGLVLPLRKNDAKLVRQYHDVIFKTRGLSAVPLSQDIAEEAARLRVLHKLTTPDAIQMATAIVRSATHFLTNDHRLPTLPNLQVIKVTNLKGH